MHLTTMLPLPNWLTQEEAKHFHKIKRAYLKHMKTKGIELSPPLAMRLHDLIMHQLYLKRAETTCFLPENPEQQATLSQLEALAKHRERLRKSLQELDSAIHAAAEEAKIGKPKNIVDFYAQYMKENNIPPQIPNSGPDPDYVPPVPHFQLPPVDAPLWDDDEESPPPYRPPYYLSDENYPNPQASDELGESNAQNNCEHEAMPEEQNICAPENPKTYRSSYETYPPQKQSKQIPALCYTFP